MTSTISSSNFPLLAGTVLHKCDPNGDVIIQLRCLYPPFAVWDNRAEYAEQGQNPINDEPQPARKEPHAGDETAPHDEAPSEDTPELLPAEEHTTAKTDDEPPSIEIWVSSRHLILASSHFRRMLKGQWEEAHSLQSNGCLRIEETDWDADALRIVMDIIHGRFRRVPKAISLEILAKIAVLVDYDECLEVVEMFSSN